MPQLTGNIFHIVKGRLEDSLTKMPVSDADISLIKASDSELIGFTRTDTTGSFLFDGLKKGSRVLLHRSFNFQRIKSFI